MEEEIRIRWFRILGKIFKTFRWRGSSRDGSSNHWKKNISDRFSGELKTKL